MAVKFANNVSTTLSSAINATQTTISVADASGLPSLSSGDYIYLTIDTDTASPTLEVVKVTAVSSNDLTVVRGQDGTTASSFSAGVKVELRVTAAALGDISSQAQTAADTESVSIDGDTMTGRLTIDYPAGVTDNTMIFLNADDQYADIIASDDGGSTVFRNNRGAFQLYVDGTANSSNTSNAQLALTIADTKAATFSSTISSGAITATGQSLFKGTSTANNEYAAQFQNSAGSTILRARNDGRVLIPSGYLYVQSSEGIYSTGAINARGGITNDGGNALSISSGAAHIAFNSKNFASVGTISSGAITTSGTITLNGSDPLVKSGTYDYLDFDDDSQNYGTGTNATVLASVSDLVLRTNTNDGGGGLFRVSTGGSSPTSLLDIHTNGNVGIGATSISSALSGSNRTLKIEDDDGADIRFVHTGGADFTLGVTNSNTAYVWNAGAHNILFGTSGAERMRLTSSGLLLVGTTSTTPAFSTGNGHAFHVGDASHMSRNGGVALVVNRGGSNGDVIQVRRDGTHVGGLRVAGGVNLAVNSEGSGGYGRLQDNGTDIAIWWTNGIYPAVDNGKDLGVSNASGRWRNLFMANGIYMGASQIVDSSRNLLNIGTISSGAISATGNSTITGSGSSSNALNVYRGSDSASAFRVLNTGEVLVSSNYFYVDASQGAYFNGDVRVRGGISNDGSNYGGDVRIHENLSISGNATLNKTDGFMYLSSIGTGNSGIYVRGIGGSNTLRSHSTGDFKWEVSGSQKMELDSGGNLDVAGRVKVTNWLELESAGAANTAQEAGIRIDYNDSPLWYIYKDNANDAALHIQSAGASGESDGSPRVRFARTSRETYFGGSVGINRYNINSGYALDVNGSIRTDALAINGTTVIDSSRNLTNIVGLYGNSGTLNHYNTNHYFKSTTSNLQAHISDTGLGIGTSPSNRLHVHSGSSSDIAKFQNNSGSFILGHTSGLTSIDLPSSGALRIRYSGTELARFSSTTAKFNGDVQLSNNTEKFAAAVYRRNAVASISNSGYTTLFTVDGNNLGSAIRMNLTGTTSSVVVNVTADIMVGHYQDILITSRSGFYTIVTLKVTSNNNEDFAVEAKTNSANALTVRIEVFPESNENVTFTSSHSFTGSSHEHQCYYGTHTTGTGGNDGDFRVGGRMFIQDGTASSGGLVFADDHDTGFYRHTTNDIGIATAGAVRARFGTAGMTVYNQLRLNDTNTQLVEGGGNSIRLKTNNGYVDIGPQNSSWAHFETDRASFYFNKKLTVNSGIIESYDEDLTLRRAQGTAHQIQIKDSGVEYKNTGGQAKLTIQSSDTADSYINFSAASNEMSLGYDKANNRMAFTNHDTLDSNIRMVLGSAGDWVVSNTNPRVASQFTNQAGMGWYESDLHAEIATTGNRSALEIGRNNSTATGDFLVFRKQASVIGSVGVEGGDSLFIQSSGSTGGGLRFHSSGRISPVRASAVSNNAIDLGASTQQFANLYLGSGLYMSGSEVINSSRGLTNVTGLNLSSSTTSGMKATFTDSTANAGFYGFHIDYNASGSDTTTGDRIHSALYIDADSSASGGGTQHEHRFYGAYVDVTASGDSDIIDGGFFGSRANDFGTGNQVTYLRGVNTSAVAHHNAGTVSNTIGVYGWGQDSSSGSGQSSNVYGGYFNAYAASTSSYTGTNFIGVKSFAQIGATQNSNLSSAVAVWGEVQFDNDTAADHNVTISSAYVFRAEYDENDADDSYTVNNGYLYYGNYAGALPTTAWGVYIADNVPNYFAGTIRTSDGSTSTASYGFIGDTNTGMYSPANHQLGFTVNGSRKFYMSTSTAFFQNLSGGVLVNASSNDTSGSMGGQTPVFYASGYSSIGGLRINGADTGNTIYKSGGNLGIKVGSAHSIDLGVGGGTHFSITSSGHTNIVNGKDLMVGGTTVIDSSRNIKNVPVIYGYDGNTAIEFNNSTYTMLSNPEGARCLYLGDSGDRGNYYDNNTHYFRNAAGSAYFLTFNSSQTDFHNNVKIRGTQGFNATGETASIYLGDNNSEIRATYNGGTKFFLNGVDRMELEGSTGNLNLKTGNFEINGTTVIDSSRNLTNIGTISAGAISSNADMTLSGNGTEINFTGGNNRIKFSGYRALEGSTDGANLQIGEGYTTAKMQADVQLDAGKHLTRSNHHTGHLEGSYNNVGNNASKSNPIYTIGENYNPADATLNNMYGIGYARRDSASYLSSFGGTHWGMYVAADGDARIFLNASSGVLAGTGGYAVGSTTIVDSARDIQNAQAETGTTGLRFKTGAWFYDTSNNARFQFVTGSHNYYKTDGNGGKHFFFDGNSTTEGSADAFIDASGNGHFAGNVTAYSSSVSSDARLKENIRPIESATETVKQLNGVVFDWKKTERGTDQLGFIAQEIEQVLPSLVTEVDTLKDENTETHKTVNYAALVPMLVESIKELTKRIEELENGNN